MNNWNFTGNIGRDAEQRFIPKGDSIVSFSVGVKSGFGASEKTVWAKCSIWGKHGESVLPYLVKGQQVAVSGELSVSEWAGKDGITKTSIEVRVNDVTLVGGKKDVGGLVPERRASAAAKTPDSGGGGNSSGFNDFEDDIPFASCSVDDDVITRKLESRGRMA